MYSFVHPNFCHSRTSYHFSPLNYFNILGYPISFLFPFKLQFFKKKYYFEKKLL